MANAANQQGNESHASHAKPSNILKTCTGYRPVTTILKYIEQQEKQDVFKEFLRDIELARVAHLLSLSNPASHYDSSCPFFLPAQGVLPRGLTIA